MKKTIFGILLILIFTGFTAAEVTDTEQLARLEGHLESIRSDFEFQRNVTGGVFLSLGAVSFLIGSMFLLPDDIGILSYDYYNLDTIFGCTFIFGGVGYGLIGAFTLFFPSENETLPKAFMKMPELSEDEIKAKIIKGEVYLESLSQKARNARFLSGGLCIVSGIGAIAYSMMLKDSGEYYDSTTSDTLFYTGITSIGFSLIALLFKTKPEIEYESYEQWKKNEGISFNQEHRPYLDIVLLKGGIGFALKY